MAVDDNGGAQNTDGQGQTQSGGQTTGQQQSGQQAASNTNSNAGGQQQAQADKSFSYKEDRGSWIPPHRLSEATQARTKAEQATAALQAQLDQATARIQALAGVNPKNPQDAEADELRAAIGKLYPKLALLDNLDEETIDRILEAADISTRSSNATWERHTHGVLNSLDVAAAKILGVAKLDDKQQERIRVAFRVEGEKAERVRQQQLRSGQRDTIDTVQGDNDFIARFERGDDTLVQEFVSDFLNGFIEPVRRSVTADVTRRVGRPVPRGDRNRTPLVQGQEQQDLSTPDGFKKALLAARGSGASTT